MPKEIPVRVDTGVPMIQIQQCDRQDGVTWFEVVDRRPLRIKAIVAVCETREQAEQFIEAMP